MLSRNTEGQFPCVPAAAPLRHAWMPVTPSVRRCIVASYSFCSASRFRKNIKDFEGGNIPPQRPSACSPQVQEKAEHRRVAPQTVYFSFSSTRSFVKVAPIRLL